MQGSEKVVSNASTKAYVPQKAIVITGSIRENVLMGLAFDAARYDEAISIAAMETDTQGRRSIIAGTVFDPVKNEFFFAERGKGAYLNGRRLRVSGRRMMADALFGTGIPFLGRGDEDDHAAFLKQLGNIMAISSGVRRNGAAALDLAWVAAGRLDGFWEKGLSLWDIAAGVLLIREAGGFVSDFASRDKALVGLSRVSFHAPSARRRRPRSLRRRRP